MSEKSASKKPIDFTGRRAFFLYAGGASSAGEDLGRRAFFSRLNPSPGQLREQKKPLEITCSACGVTSYVDFLEFLKRKLPLPLWLPTRTHSHFLSCPSCGRRTWVKARLTLLSELEGGG